MAQGQFKILLVDDAFDVQAVIQSSIGKKYPVKWVKTAEEAALELGNSEYSLVILDVSLPGENGFTFCANLRAEEKYKNLPVIFLTSKAQTRDKILAFSLGADDYVTKPIDIPEFQARIDAKMRRLEAQSSTQNVFAKGPFRVALNEQKIFADDKDLKLSTIEFKLFYYFLRHENHVLTRDQILNEVWGQNTHVTDRSVDTYIYSLRKKLGSYSGWVQSIPRIGYRFAAADATESAS